MTILTEELLLSLVAAGESETLEFKERTPPDGIIAKNLVAFANAKGGTLLIGIGDKGDIPGLDVREANDAVQRIKRVSESILLHSVRVGSTKVGDSNVEAPARTPISTNWPPRPLVAA